MSRLFLILGLALWPLGAWAADTATTTSDGMEVIEEIDDTATDPTALFSESAAGLTWGGTVDSKATWWGGWVGAWPSAPNLTAGTRDGLDYGLSTKLYLDGRPDEDFRFRLSLKTGYPFTNDTENVEVAKTTGTSTTTLAVPNIKIWEMFTDVTLADAVFLRFGKQSASWGVSYFYSPGDVISLTAKDASDPTAEREGPLALKATVPFPGWKANLTGFVLARDSYFGSDLPSLQTLGYALQADALVGEAQVTLGGFYQRDNAPKAVATVNTGLKFLPLPLVRDLDLFSEAVVSYGSDVLKGAGTVSSSLGNTYASLGGWDRVLYYTGTLGVSYSNSDANLTLRAEYLYNPFGSADKDAATKAYNAYILQAAHNLSSTVTLPWTSSVRDYGYGDAMTPGIHNLTGLASLSEVAGTDKLTFTTLWQQNLSDGSGWVKPEFGIEPWDVLTFTWGLSLVYGDDGTQFPLQFQAYDKDGSALGTKRVTMNVGVTFGTGKY